jgi:two-component system nitrate/nitrite response regulator NarL
VVRILLVDDHLLLRQAVREIVAREADLEVVAEAGDGREAVRLANEAQPDVVLMDLTLPVCDGFQATQELLACSPRSHVVIFSASAEERDMLRALQCGALGYVTKDVGAESLLTAIRRVAQDELYITPPLAARLPALLRTLDLEGAQKSEGALGRPPAQSPQISKKRSRRNLPLTGRERQVLNLIRQGQRSREIAQELRIAESTVHKHVQHILEKLHARNRAEALFLVNS